MTNDHHLLPCLLASALLGVLACEGETETQPADTSRDQFLAVSADADASGPSPDCHRRRQVVFPILVDGADNIQQLWLQNPSPTRSVLGRLRVYLNDWYAGAGGPGDLVYEEDFELASLASQSWDASEICTPYTSTGTECDWAAVEVDYYGILPLTGTSTNYFGSGAFAHHVPAVATEPGAEPRPHLLVIPFIDSATSWQEFALHNSSDETIIVHADFRNSDGSAITMDETDSPIVSSYYITIEPHQTVVQNTPEQIGEQSWASANFSYIGPDVISGWSFRAQDIDGSGGVEDLSSYIPVVKVF